MEAGGKTGNRRAKDDVRRDIHGEEQKFRQCSPGSNTNTPSRSLVSYDSVMSVVCWFNCVIFRN